MLYNYFMKKNSNFMLWFVIIFLMFMYWWFLNRWIIKRWFFMN